MSEEKERVLFFGRGRHDPTLTSKGIAGLIKSAQGNGDLNFVEIVGLASTYQRGSVSSVASESGIPFYFVSDGMKDAYAKIFKTARPDLCVFCDWELPVHGLNPARTISLFRGFQKGYRDAHKQDTEAYLKGQAIETVVTACFMLPGEFKPGPEIIAIPVPINNIQLNVQEKDLHSESPEEHVAHIIRRCMREVQIHYLPQIIVHVLCGLVVLNDDHSVTVPDSYASLIQSIRV